MLDELRERSVAILVGDTLKIAGTGMLLDSQHILTCAHVAAEACKSQNEVTDSTEISIFPMEEGREDKLASKIVYSLFQKSSPEGKTIFSFPKFKGSYEELSRSGFEFTDDLVLLKTDQPIKLLNNLINWKSYTSGIETLIEGFGFHQSFGEDFEGIIQGKRLRKLQQFQLLPAGKIVQSFKGASGTALLAKDSNIDEIVGYGVLVAEPKNTTNSTDFAYIIPGDAVKQFLAGYRVVKLNPSPASIKKNYMPQGRNVQQTKFTPELASSLIDRHFLAKVESNLNDNGVVFMALSGEQQDWFAGINKRLINGKELSLDSAGLVQKKPFRSLLFDWPGHENGKNTNGRKSTILLLKEFVPRVLSGLSMHSYASAESDEVQEQDVLFNAFHSAIKNCERAVIGIKLQQGMLHTAEKLVIERLIDELKQYFKDGKRLDNEVQILCYLVIDSTLQNSKHKIAQLWDKLTSLKMHSIANILRELSSTNKFCYEDIQALQKIELSHLSNWETQLESCGLGEEKIELLKYHAKQIINPQQGIRHSHFMRELDSSLLS